jgi:zinc protease
MKHLFKKISLLILCLIIATNLNAKVNMSDMNAEIPTNPKVKTGTLSNGIKYYIMENQKPENRAEIRIVVNTGSVDEDDDQKGLAHFIEHMCFNGTKNFPKNELVNFLETTGMKFGGDINAGTGFERTQYFLVIPTDKPQMMEKGLQVLEDWAHNVTFDAEEIEKERGVIIEEWRVRLNPGSKIFVEQMPYILHGSKFPERFIIGDTNVIRTAPREVFVRFYEDWYRPSDMAVIAVGDFNAKDIEKMIKEKFSRIEPAKNPRPHEGRNIGSHKETFVKISKDKELPRASFSVYISLDKANPGTYEGFRKGIIDRLVDGMLGARYREITQKPDSPFQNAYGAFARDFIGDKSFYLLGTSPKQDDPMKSFEAMLVEAFRAKQHGFVETELERAKTSALSNLESAYAEREKTENNSYCEEITRNFQYNEAMPGVEVELEIMKAVLPEITLADVNAAFNAKLTDENVTITGSFPDNGTFEIPTEKEVLAVYEDVKKRDLDAYEDVVIDEPLIATLPTPGKITKTKEHKSVGVIEFELSNGAKVFVKPTKFQDDEIIVSAYAPGGSSIADDDMYASATLSASLLGQMGVGSFDVVSLQKKLAGKQVNVRTYISDVETGFRGSSTMNDFETLMQLIYLGYTAPRLDYEASESFMKRIIESVENSKASPKSQWRDSTNYIASNYNFRSRPWTREMLEDDVDADDAYDFIKARLANGSNYTFFFVGNLDMATLKPLLEQYIASLPAGKKETFVDRKETYPKGQVNHVFKKGADPQAMISIRMNDDFVYNFKNRMLARSMMEIFSIKLRELIREELGGTYSPSAYISLSNYPTPEYSVRIGFGLSPDRTEEMKTAINSVIKDIKDNKVDDIYMTKMYELQKSAFVKNMQENGYWLGTLKSYYSNKENFDQLNTYEKELKKITKDDIQKAAQKYLSNDKNMMTFLLMPGEQVPTDKK